MLIFGWAAPIWLSVLVLGFFIAIRSIRLMAFFVA